ncbi:glycerophosphodiester phosphodiesterase family protein [Nostocoides jenkinsii]|uniref:Putative glycerophosphoryl diester phosphodiesterase n=1 Tax=Nostocoides jenkinsii Ben 74 TaxID=1193518 RepID=A0A077MAD1_9MICO|nr:glycerophosphodiester phosphodiesterase family protein [Tetrasphaera jenkinsii]CCI54326.1 putative glycerophosphoryl diester phosphodiesterase [Tetrasphaera jenkinsii Ben 74]
MRAADHPYFDNDGPIALAHRGGSFYAPNIGRENTIAAFAEAVSLGYRYLETDVHATADGRLVAFHDDRLERVTDGRGAIASLPYAEVDRARTVGGDAIPLLDDVLDAFPETRFNIDCKAPGAVAPLLDAVARHNAYDRVCLASFSAKRLTQLRAGGGTRLATSAGPRGVVALRFTPHLVSRLLHSGAPVLQIPVTHELRGRALRTFTEGLLGRAHALGKQVHIWTIDDPAEMHRLLDLGVDGLVTDRIDVLADVLAERGHPLTPPT